MCDGCHSLIRLAHFVSAPEIFHLIVRGLSNFDNPEFHISLTRMNYPIRPLLYDSKEAFRVLGLVLG